MSIADRIAAGSLRGPAFDSLFIAGIPAVALACGLLVTLRPELFILIFTLDLWLLGYHHVAATFTRICFDSESFKSHRSLVLVLPIVVGVGVIACVSLTGLWFIATTYLYWQWWHYTRQSEGIEKAYAGRNSGMEIGDRRLARIVHYALPIAGILTVSARNPGEFVFMPIRTLPVPMEVAYFAQAAALVVTLWWLAEQFLIWRRGRLAATYAGYLASHLIIYGVAYIGFDDATRGWLVINMWHNAQYLVFVWMFNNKRFGGAYDQRHALLSTISQTKNWWLYLLACLAISAGFYYSIEAAFAVFGISTVAYMAAAYQVINFHHYIVDSRIWKLRRPVIRKHVGIA